MQDSAPKTTATVISVIMAATVSLRGGSPRDLFHTSGYSRILASQ